VVAERHDVVFVGRGAEVERLGGLVRCVAAGEGASVLVEGEPGIGKSSLVQAGVAEAGGLGCRLLWAVGDELSQRFPLRVLTGCLGEDSVGVAAGSVGGDPVPAAVERLLARIDRLCAVSPVVLVLDDLQWADEASLLAWHRLHQAVQQLPLLLVAACRPTPRRPEVELLCRRLVAGGVAIRLGPLANADVLDAAERMLGAVVGPRLRRMAERCGGNPLYLREIIDGLVREGSVVTRTDEVAEALDIAQLSLPASLSEAIAARLEFLSAEATDVLRLAALLGLEFTVAEVALVLRRAPTELIGALEEARRSGVLVEVGSRLAFRHPLIRHALYDAMPETFRLALHHQAARALAEAGGPVERVAQQLHASDVVDNWLLDWLIRHQPALAGKAPQVAADLLERAIAGASSADPRQPELATLLAELYFRLDRQEETVAVARRALSQPLSTPLRARLTWTLAYRLGRGGDRAGADATVLAVLGDPALTTVEAARLGAMYSLWHCHGDRPDKDLTVADRALAQAERSGDGPAIALALHSLSLLALASDHARAVEYIDRGLAVLSTDVMSLALRPVMLSNRAVALASLGRAEEHRAAMRELAAMADNGEVPPQLGRQLRLSGIAQAYVTGEWDDATAGLDALLAIDGLPPDPYLVLFARGLAAALAAHRDDRATAERHIAAAPPARTGADHNHSAYLLLARSMLAERAGNRQEALTILARALEPDFAGGTGIVQGRLFPEMVRLAVMVGEKSVARAGLRAAEQMARDPTPFKISWTQRCTGLINADPVPLAAAAESFRATGRRIDQLSTLADLAAVHAARGETVLARAAFTEAVNISKELGADWDLLRITTQMRALGIRRGRRGEPLRRRPTTGWQALTATEVRVATMVATGMSNPDIAEQLHLSRRTIQTHVSNILAKLNATSRKQIARAAPDHQPA
jgi:DNA-binding CsgD family transcriptional regulator